MMHIDCGEEGFIRVEWALKYLPDALRLEWDDRLAFVCTAQSDAKRLTRKFRNDREIIVLSERIIPKPSADEADPDVRYFVFVVLHEIAHAINDDEPQKTNEMRQMQEDRADALAFEWFNNYIKKRNVPSLLPLTREELALAQEKTRALMKAALNELK